LIQILAQRRATETIEELLQAAVDDDPTVRAAAMTALGQLAGPGAIAGMVQGVLKAAPGAERAAAEKSIMLVCHRITDPAERAAPLLTVMEKLPRRQRTALLSTLGRVGGPAARPIIEAAVADRDRTEHAEGIRAVANWPDASIAAWLIDLAQSDPHPDHRITALRALIRVAPLPDERSDLDRLALLQQAMTMCDQERERKLVLERARAVRIPETLRFVMPYLDQPALAAVACQTVVELAHHRTLREANQAEFHQALDKVIQTSQDAVVVDRAQRYKRNETWVRPKAGESP
jgi:HEAT repeat protein